MKLNISYMRRLAAMIVALTAWMGASAATMTASDVKGVEGTEAEISISLTNKDITIVALQFDMTLGGGTTVASDANGAPAFSLTSRGSKQQIAVNGSGGSYRVVTYSNRNDSYSNTSGAIIKCKVVLGTPGTYKAQFSNVRVTAKNLTEYVLDDFSSTITVEKKYVAVGSVTLSQTAVSLLAGQTCKLTATVSPADASNPAVTWKSSDASVAKVDADGTVTAVKVGKATITATAEGVSAQCQVTVNPTPAEKVVLDKSAIELMIGKSERLTATVLPENTTDKTVTWKSSDASVAKVDANGTVTAVYVGTATVTATCGSASATCTVKVNPIPAENIVMSATYIELAVGATGQVSATVQPENTTYKDVSWRSSDEAIATVDANGKITAVAIGTAAIVATCGDATGYCAVKVTPRTADEVRLDKTELELMIGKSEHLTATVLPENTSNKTVTWTSSDETVAVVDDNGTVTAVYVGTATITAYCGGASGACTVTVTPIPVERITMDTNEFIELKVGDTKQLSATVYPENATFKEISWRSTDESVITVDNTGLLTAVGVGNCVILASCGGYSTFSTAKVVAVEAERLVLDKTELALLVDEDEQLTATVLPENTTDKTVTWSTTDASVAEVTDDGRITAVGEGVAVVTARCGNASSFCIVSVGKHTQTIEWEQDFNNLYEGHTLTLTATATSGLDVEYEIVSGTELAKLEGATVELLTAGDIVVRASQPGDRKYKAAEPISVTINILRSSGVNAALADGLSVRYEGNELIVNGEGEIEIYSLDGRTVYRGTDRRIALRPGAMYILRIGNATFKLATL